MRYTAADGASLLHQLGISLLTSGKLSHGSGGSSEAILLEEIPHSHLQVLARDGAGDALSDVGRTSAVCRRQVGAKLLEVKEATSVTLVGHHEGPDLNAPRDTAASGTAVARVSVRPHDDTVDAERMGAVLQQTVVATLPRNRVQTNTTLVAGIRARRCCRCLWYSPS